VQGEQFSDRLFERFKTGDAIKMFYYDDSLVVRYTGTVLGIEGNYYTLVIRSFTNIITGKGFNQMLVLHDPGAQATLRFPLNSPRILRLQVMQRNFEEPTRKFYELM
jgi:ribosomal protein L19